MKYILWTHDPCPEGGWSMKKCDSLEEAKALAYDQLNREVADLQEMRLEMPDYDGCYDGYVITPDTVEERRINLSLGRKATDAK